MVGMEDGMARRNEREDMVVAAAAIAGWSRDARKVPGAIPAYRATYRLGYVDAGTGEGRGTTLVDAFRSNGRGGYAFLSVKGSSLEVVAGNLKFPAYSVLMTGRRDTLVSVIDAVRAGAGLPVLHFASLPDGDGNPSREGFYLAFDAAHLIRAAGDLSPHAPGHRWGRGCMPAVSVGMSPGIKSGGKYIRHLPGWSPSGDWTYATDEAHVAYPRLEIGYLNAGLAGSWRPCNVRDIPDIIEGVFPW
jgi:hypothetical protein